MSSAFEVEPVLAWSLYFPHEESTAGDERLSLIRRLAEFFATPAALSAFVDVGEIRAHRRTTMDYTALADALPVEGFAGTLKDHPQVALAILGMAVHHTLAALKVPFAIPRVQVRLTGYGPVTPFQAVRSNFVDKFIALRGNVVRVGGVKPLVKAMRFVCAQCGAEQSRVFPDGRYAPPQACAGEGGSGRCKGRQFNPDRESAEAVDWQVIRLQEIVSSEEADQGRVPRTIDCELTEDLVDCVIPGDVVTVAAVLKARKTQAGAGARGQNKSLYVLYADVNSVSNGSERDGGKADVLAFTPRDMRAVVKIAQEEGLFRLLVSSLAPAIFGNEVVKAGLLLALMGGAPRPASADRTRMQVRTDSHVLIVGDPGLGKSQMLRATVNAAPRGVYVCGNTATSSGLTVTMKADGGKNGDYALEAGALVLGDMGVCCIDEFDKMNADPNSLLEAMEQQTISIAKAGIVCSLAARTAVLAAANPVGGHYDRSRTVAENLKISSALLSRFDLIFIMLDRPDEARDQMLSEHVLAQHASSSSSSSSSSGSSSSSASSASTRPPLSAYGSSQLRGDGASQLTPAAQRAEWAGRKPLRERLRLSPAEHARLDPVPQQLLRKYIAYARKYVRPRLTVAAREVLRQFYLKLRQEQQTDDGTPITTRQLESMIRLAEARAKCELRESVTADDARDVVEIMRESLYDVMADDLGHVDFRRAATGMSRAKQATVFVKALHVRAQRRESALFSMNELREVAAELRLDAGHFGAFVDSLNEQGILLKKGPRGYLLQSSDFASSSQRGGGAGSQRRRKGGGGGGGGGSSHW